MTLFCLLLFEWNCTRAKGDGDNAQVLKLLQGGVDATVRNECVIFVMYYCIACIKKMCSTNYRTDVLLVVDVDTCVQTQVQSRVYHSVPVSFAPGLLP